MTGAVSLLHLVTGHQIKALDYRERRNRECLHRTGGRRSRAPDMAKLMGSAIKSAVSGEEDTEKLQAQMEQAQASTAAAESSGLSAYSAKADAAEAQVS